MAHTVTNKTTVNLGSLVVGLFALGVGILILIFAYRLLFDVVRAVAIDHAVPNPWLALAGITSFSLGLASMSMAYASVQPDTQKRRWVSTLFIALFSLVFIFAGTFFAVHVFYFDDLPGADSALDRHRTIRTIVGSYAIGLIGLLVVYTRMKSRFVERKRTRYTDTGPLYTGTGPLYTGTGPLQTVQPTISWLDLLRNPQKADQQTADIQIKPTVWIVLVLLFSVMLIFGLLYLGR